MPESFFGNWHPNCGWWFEVNGGQIGCHCIEDNSDCRKIVQFFTLEGKSRIKTYVKLLMNDAITSFPNKFVSSFSTLIEELIYPTFKQKFSKKFDLFHKKKPDSVENVLSIKTVTQCKAYGIECVVAMDRVNYMIQKLYSIFTILNEDFSKPLQSSSNNERSRYMGTLLANLQSQLGDDIDDIASLKLENDLKTFLRTIIPKSEISLTDMIAILGYSDIHGKMSKHSFEPLSWDNASRTGCSSSKSSMKTSSGIEKLPKLKIIGPSLEVEENCDFNNYTERWKSYFQLLFQGPNSGLTNCHTGKYL